MFAFSGTSWPSLAAVVALWLLPSSAHGQAGVVDLEGRDVRPVQVADGRTATVLLFTAVDCPISDRYAPAVRRLARAQASRGVQFWLVYANAGEQPAAAKAHAQAFAYGLPIALDPSGALADRAGATVTPEAAVFDATGRIAYRGRIDDRYVEFGVDTPGPTTHDLADAVSAVLAGHTVARPETRAVGCAIVRRQP